ncbi:MAG: sugar O-acyltransferase (sialic acid O-acetyltransferase NeuD family) [Mariniflexile sp.]|jgi:sugar O-acyltransferase (sialic acid O-acetyltransferase NeuD family)
MNCVIIGAGNYSYVLLNYINEQKEKVNIIGFLDDDVSLHGTLILGKPVLGDLSLLKSLNSSHKVEGVYCPIGNIKVRVKLLKLAVSLGFKLPNFIHKSAVLGPNVTLGKGIYVMPGTIVMPSANISNYCMLSMGISVGHDTLFEEGVFVANGCNIGGNIIIKKETFVGMGATIISGVKSIGQNCIIGAGSVVIRDIQNNVTVVGNPAKIIKINKI